MGNVPKLRFKEFDGDWFHSRLGCLTSRAGYGIGSAATAFDGTNKYLRITDIDESSRRFLPNPLTSPEGIIDSRYILREGDIVFARTGASTGKSYLYNPDDGKLVFAGFLIKFHIDQADPYFIYLNTFRGSYDHWVKVMSVRSGQPGINAEEYKLLPVSLPSLPEQQKIAAFLTAVDTKIEQLTKKEQHLQQYKKGVMQKLFSQEIRFKADDGSEFPEWRRFRLSDFLVSENREVPKPHSEYLALGLRSHCKGTFKKPNSDPSKIAMDKLFRVKANDLVVNITFAWEGAITIAKPEDDGGLVSHRFPCFTFDKTVTEHNFFQYVISHKRFRHYLDLISPGGAGRNRVMSKKDFVKLKWTLPSLDEQKEISNFLGSVEQKIYQTSKQLEAAKTFKKGLLQQMFE